MLFIETLWNSSRNLCQVAHTSTSSARCVIAGDTFDNTESHFQPENWHGFWQKKKEKSIQSVFGWVVGDEAFWFRISTVSSCALRGKHWNTILLNSIDSASSTIHAAYVCVSVCV